MSNLKNVVIVGASSGGATLARALEKSLPITHRIVLIDANESAYWSIGGLRAATVPGYEEKVFHSLAGFFGKDSRHIVLPSTKVVTVEADHVTIDREAAPFGTTIPVEYAVLATGSDYGAPCRASSSNTAEAKASLKQQQIDLQKAQSVLLIGGGPVGIEWAGEIAAQYPSKKITLVTRGPTLLSPAWKPSFPAKLEGQLKRAGVEIIYNTSIDVDAPTGQLLPGLQSFTAGGHTVEADFIGIGTGGKPQVSVVPAAALKDGRIAVDDSLRLTYAPLADRYFSLGDASGAVGPKTHYAAGLQAPVVAANITAAAKGSKATKTWKEPGAMLSVPVGPNDGSTQMMGMVVGGFITKTVKAKTLFQSMFDGVYVK